MPITGKNLRLQKFPFRPKFVSYLIENADAEIMQKFHRCCKQLYQMAPYFIVDSFDFYHDSRRFENKKYDGCLDFVNYEEFQLFIHNLENIWLMESVKVLWNDMGFLEDVVRCSASELLLYCVELPFDTFKLLTESGKVEKLAFEHVFYPDGSVVPLEDVLAQVPNLKFVHTGTFCATPETMKKLIEIPWKQKFNYLRFCNVTGKLDADLFFKFVKVIIDL